MLGFNRKDRIINTDFPEMINKRNVEKYIKDLFGNEALHVNINKLGEGVQGAGFLIEIMFSVGPFHQKIILPAAAD